VNASGKVLGALAITVLMVYLSNILINMEVEPAGYKFIICFSIFSLGGAFYNVDRISNWIERKDDHEDRE
jgi:hypothetical protein